MATGILNERQGHGTIVLRAEQQVNNHAPALFDYALFLQRISLANDGCCKLIVKEFEKAGKVLRDLHDYFLGHSEEGFVAPRKRTTTCTAWSAVFFHHRYDRQLRSHPLRKIFLHEQWTGL